SPAVSPDGRWVWVSNFGQGESSTLSVIDAETLSEVARVPVGVHPHGIVWSPDGTRLYATLEGESAVVVLDPARREVIGRWSTGDGPHALALSPAGRTLWTGDLDSHTVTVLDTTTGARLGRIDLGSTGAPHAIAFAADGRTAYITNFFTREVIVVAAAG